MPSEDPSCLGWSWGHRREDRREQERQEGRVLQDQRSRKGAEGICPTQSGMGSLLSSQASPPPSKAPSRPYGSWEHRRVAREIRRGRWEGSSRTGGAGEELRALSPPTRAQEAYWAPWWGPPPSETRGGGAHLGLFCSVEPKPHPPTPQPTPAISSPVGTKHMPRPLPKPHPCLGPALHSQGLFDFFIFLLFFFTIVVLFYLLVVVSSIFLFLYFF